MEEHVQTLAEQVVAGLARELAPRLWTLATVDYDDDFASFVKSNGTEVELAITVDLLLRESGLGLNPTLGVRHREVERLATQFMGRDSGTTTIAATLADRLYQSGGDAWDRWIVRSPQEIESVARLVGTDVDKHGAVFFASFSTLDDIISDLVSRDAAFFTTEWRDGGRL